MNRFTAILIALIASLGIYPVSGNVTEVDRVSDTVTFTTCSGHSFAFKGCEDWASNDLVSAIMWDAGTPDVRDDVILSALYSGFYEWIPDAFPHRREFDADFRRDFPGEDYDLYGEKELTAQTLVSRKSWGVYLVEVVQYTVTDVYHAKSDGADPSVSWNMAVGKFAPGEEYAPGSRAVSYLVYALNSDGVDDIIARYDYLLH